MTETEGLDSHRSAESLQVWVCTSRGLKRLKVNRACTLAEEMKKTSDMTLQSGNLYVNKMLHVVF